MTTLTYLQKTLFSHSSTYSAFVKDACISFVMKQNSCMNGMQIFRCKISARSCLGISLKAGIFFLCRGKKN